MSTIEAAVETLTLNVSGMTCGSCVRHVTRALEQVPGFQEARVDLPAGRIHLSYQSGAATPDTLLTAVTRAGYPAALASASTESGSSGATPSCGCCAPRTS